MTLPSWPAMALFVAQVLVLALYGLTVSGHFPAEHRRPSLRSKTGTALIWITLGVAICAAVLSGMRAASLPLAPAVIGAGAAVLFAPLLLQPLPDSFVDSPVGLITLSTAAAGLAALSLTLA